MNKINGDNFCRDAKYKLYRTVYEILHPSISKRNISNYKVVLDEKLLPVQVFYPKRVTNMKKVILAIPGDGKVTECYGKYATIYKNMAIETETLIIAIDYFGKEIKYPTSSNKIFKVVKFLMEEFISNGILKENIIFMSDSVGCNILKDLLFKLREKDFIVDNKIIWFYPVCQNSYENFLWDEKYLSMNFNLDKRINEYLDGYFSKGRSETGNSLVIDEDSKVKNIVFSGELDVLKNEAEEFSRDWKAEFVKVRVLGHGFLGKINSEGMKEVYSRVNDFVKF